MPEHAPKVLIWLETHTKPDIGAGKRPSKVSEGGIWQRPGKTEINLLCLVQAHGRHRSTIPEEGGPFVREEHVVTRLHKTHRAAQSRCRKLCPHAGKRTAEPTEVDEGPLLGRALCSSTRSRTTAPTASRSPPSPGVRDGPGPRAPCRIDTMPSTPRCSTTLDSSRTTRQNCQSAWVETHGKDADRIRWLVSLR